jgi:hypothetical protein
VIYVQASKCKRIKCHVHSGGPISDVDETSLSVLALLSCTTASTTTYYQYSKQTMQNASGLWGKVKSQAQQAGSMAQGAINVSTPSFGSTENELSIQNGGQRATTGGQGFMQSFSLPGESQKAAKILQHFLGQSEVTHVMRC